jgi:hypothetical protein
MPSQSLDNFLERLAEVQQLVDAHGALVRFKRAQDAHQLAAGDLSKIGEVIDALVSDPGAGRPPAVQALNSAAIGLLSGHLQGFITELFEECARLLLDGHVLDVGAVIEAAPTRGNPNEQNITKLFAAVGFPAILGGVSWRRMSNASLRKHLREFNELRNRIVHGKGETVTKKRVELYMSMWTNLAKRLDTVVGKEIAKRTGKAPW